MILGIGTDIVLIDRLVRWQSFSHERLHKIFAPSELLDCTEQGVLQPNKLATRFAAKEAFYKALCAALVRLDTPARGASCMAVGKQVTVCYAAWHVPQLVVNWQALDQLFAYTLPPLQVDLSLAHERDHAVAFVVISGCN